MSVIVKKNRYVYCVYLSDGKQKWEPFGLGPDALIAAQTRDIEIKKLKRDFRPVPVDDLTFVELFNLYIKKRKVELSTKTVEEIFNTTGLYASPVIGKKYVRRISIDDWYAIQDRMTARGIAARSINKYFQYLSKVLSWGINNLGELRTMPHPWGNREPLRMKRFTIDLCTLEDLQAIIAAAPDHLRWAIEVEYHTGMRPGRTELFNLKWDDIDFETGAVRVYSSKTDRHHIQYVTLAFLERVKEKRQYYRAEAERLSKRRGGVVFPECPYVIQFRGDRIKSQVSTSWREAKEKAGITKLIRLYDIRHFYITHALKGGANILDLAQRVGHQGPEMITRVYAHLVDDMSEKKALAIPELIERPFDQSNDHAKGSLDCGIRPDKKEAAGKSATS